jgi:hypothetical protein
VQLSPGDAHDAPARRLEAAVAGAVGLEGVGGVVDLAAVELDDEAVRGPRAVDFQLVDADVRLGHRKTGIDEEGLEALFELASDDPEALLHLFKEGSDVGDAGLARIALDEIAQPEAIGEPKLLGLPESAPELVALKDGTEVEKRPGHGGGRDSVMGGDLVVGQIGPVEADSLARSPAAARHGHLDPAAPAHAPEGSRSEIAQDGGRPAREHRGKPPTVPREQARPDDRVDPAVHGAKPALPDPIRNGTRTKGKL